MMPVHAPCGPATETCIRGNAHDTGKEASRSHLPIQPPDVSRQYREQPHCRWRRCDRPRWVQRIRDHPRGRRP